MMIMGECVTGWNWESQRAELSQEHPERNYFGSELQYVPCFLLTPSTQPYMEPRSVDSSLLPILKVFFFISSFTVGNLISWLQSLRWEKLSLSLVFQPCPEVLVGCLLYFPASEEELGSSACLLSFSFPYSSTLSHLLAQVSWPARCSLVLMYLFEFGCFCGLAIVALLLWAFPAISLLWVGIQPREAQNKA